MGSRSASAAVIPAPKTLILLHRKVVQISPLHVAPLILMYCAYLEPHSIEQLPISLFMHTCLQYHVLMMFLLCLVIITANPDDQMICVGGTAVMNCGFDNGVALTPLARINGTSHASDNPPIAGLPLQFITPNDTNATRIVVGPVGEQFIGTANFSCSFSLRPPVISMTATLTVVGKCVC